MNTPRPADPAYPSARWLLELKRVRRVLAHPLTVATANGGCRVIRERETVLLRLCSAENVAQRNALCPEQQQAQAHSNCTTPTAHTGYGEAAPLPWFGSETAEESFAALSALGQSIDDANAALEFLGVKTPCARWALECALAQIHAQAQQTVLDKAAATHAAVPQTPTPPTQTMHTASTPMPTLAPLPIAALLASGSESASAAEVQMQVLHSLEQALCHGHRVFKLKIGARLFAQEVELVRKLLERFADAGSSEAAPLKLRLDANGGLSLSDFRSWLSLLKPFAQQIDFIEQPLPAGKEEEMAEASIGSPIQWALDESLTTLTNLKHFASRYPQAALVVKPSLLGERSAFLHWREHANNRQRKVVYSTALETGIGFFHGLHLAAAAPQQPPIAAGFGTSSLFADDGLALPPQAPFAAPQALASATTLNAMHAIWKRA